MSDPTPKLPGLSSRRVHGLDPEELVAGGGHPELLARIIGRDVDAVRVGRVRHRHRRVGPTPGGEIRRALDRVGHPAVARHVLKHGIGA